MKPPVLSNPEGFDVFDALAYRSGAPLWMLWSLLGFVFLGVILLWGGAVMIRRREERHVRKGFHLLADERGLNEVEEALLLKLVTAARPENLLTIFVSVAIFERGVDALMAGVSSAPGDSGDLAAGLKHLRKKLGFDRLPERWTLRHSRQIPLETRLMVGFKRVERTRFCTCVVVDSDPLKLEVSPLLRHDETALEEVAAGERFYVRFWMNGDTEYKFRSTLLEETGSQRSTLFLAHSDHLERLQQRDFFRLRVHIPIKLYGHDAEKEICSPSEVSIEDPAQYRAQAVLEDLSAGGAAIHADETLDEGELLVVDPAYRGDFSLAGVVCRVLRSEKSKESGQIYYLEFVNATRSLQDRLVRELYKKQLSISTG